MIPMGQRNAGDGGAAGRRGDSGHHLERDAMADQDRHLLAAAAEQERVAALEPQHAPAVARQAHHQGADVVLRHRPVAAALADIDTLRRAPHQFENFGRDQPVMQHHLRATHQPQRAQSQKIGIAGPGSDQIDFAGSDHSTASGVAGRSPSARSSAASSGRQEPQLVPAPSATPMDSTVARRC